MCVCVFSHVQLFATPWTIAHQALLSMGLSQQEYWNGLPFPPARDLPDPRIELESHESPALAGGFFTTEPPEKPPSKLVSVLNMISLFTLRPFHGCEVLPFSKLNYIIPKNNGVGLLFVCLLVNPMPFVKCVSLLILLNSIFSNSLCVLGESQIHVL